MAASFVDGSWKRKKRTLTTCGLEIDGKETAKDEESFMLQTTRKEN